MKTATGIDGLAALLREVTHDGRMYVRIGTVVTPPAPNAVVPTAGRNVSIMLQPSGAVVECRVAVLAAGVGKGVYTRLVPGEEVVVLMPDGDSNGAIVLGSLNNAINALTASALVSTGTLIQDPLGVELRSADGLPADGVVLGNFLAALQAYVTAMSTFMAAVSAAGVEPTLAPAAVAFQSATAAFVAALGTSASFVDPTTGGVGGAPFASTLVRSTA